MAKKKVPEREVSTKQFAAIAGVTAKTARGYCLKIYHGDQKVLDDLSKLYGLVSVHRHPDRWGMTVREVKK